MIRNAAKAVIVRDGHVLLLRCLTKDGREFFELPGGGQNPYESMEEAVIRECLEETGLTVKVERFLALYEEILTNEAFRAEHPGNAHCIFHIFVCGVEDVPPVTPSEIDELQDEARWVPLDQVAEVYLHPRALAVQLQALLAAGGESYLGMRRVESVLPL